MSNQSDKELQDVLKIIEKFGFSFFGYNEAQEPLVVSPNGQVVTVSVALNFVKAQVNKVQGEKSGSPESIPQMSVDIEKVKENVDIGFESGIESKSEKPENKENGSSKNQQPSASTPTVAVVNKQVEKYFGEGFNPKVFDWSKLSQVKSFVEENAQKSNTTSDAWLAKLFEKFMQEMQNNI